MSDATIWRALRAHAEQQGRKALIILVPDDAEEGAVLQLHGDMLGMDDLNSYMNYIGGVIDGMNLEKEQGNR